MAAIAKWTVRIYTAGSNVPVIPAFDLPAASVGCGQTMPAGGSTINPTEIVFEDPNGGGKACIWLDPSGSGVLATIPDSATPYEATITATSATGATSPESARSAAFTVNSAPPAPTGVKLIRP